MFNILSRKYIYQSVSCRPQNSSKTHKHTKEYKYVTVLFSVTCYQFFLRNPLWTVQPTWCTFHNNSSNFQINQMINITKKDGGQSTDSGSALRRPQSLKCRGEKVRKCCNLTCNPQLNTSPRAKCRRRAAPIVAHHRYCSTNPNVESSGFNSHWTVQCQQ